MTTRAGPRTFYSERSIKLKAEVHGDGDVTPPVPFIKIHGQKGARLIRQHWIDADNDTPPQMILNDLLIQRGVPFVAAFGASNPGLAAKAGLPLIQADWPIPECPFAAVLPPLCVDISAALERRPEQGDLSGGTEWLLTSEKRFRSVASSPGIVSLPAAEGAWTGSVGSGYANCARPPSSVFVNKPAVFSQ